MLTVPVAARTRRQGRQQQPAEDSPNRPPKAPHRRTGRAVRGRVCKPASWRWQFVGIPGGGECESLPRAWDEPFDSVPGRDPGS